MSSVTQDVMHPFVQHILELLGSYPELLSFIAPIISGEVGVIFVAFLGAGGAFPLQTVLLWTCLGMIAIDSFWFLFPQTKLYRRMVKHRYVDAHYQKLERRLETITGNKDVLIFLLSKILVGTRILVIVFIGARKMPYLRFLGISILVNAIWAAALVSIGFLARGGFERTLEAFQNVQIALLLIVGAFVLLFYVMKKISKWILIDK